MTLKEILIAGKLTISEGGGPTPPTPPTLASSSNIFTVNSGVRIFDPYSADHSILNAYKTATNWTDYASYIVEEPQ